jgi:hypothetical protein
MSIEERRAQRRAPAVSDPRPWATKERGREEYGGQNPPRQPKDLLDELADNRPEDLKSLLFVISASPDATAGRDAGGCRFRGLAPIGRRRVQAASCECHARSKCPHRASEFHRVKRVGAFGTFRDSGNSLILGLSSNMP